MQLDAWDGYAGERKEILEHFVANGVQNLAALTGDIHTFIAGDMTTTGREGGTPAGVELVGGSATSLGLPEFLGVPSSTLYPLAGRRTTPTSSSSTSTAAATPWSRRRRRTSTCEFKAVDALTPGAKPTPLKSFRVVDGVPALQVV